MKKEIKTQFELEQEVYYIDEFTNEHNETIYDIVPAHIEKIICEITKDIEDTVYYMLDDLSYRIEDEIFGKREKADMFCKELNKRAKESMK